MTQQLSSGIIEYEPGCCDVIITRWQKLTGKQVVAYLSKRASLSSCADMMAGIEAMSPEQQAFGGRIRELFKQNGLLELEQSSR